MTENGICKTLLKNTFISASVYTIFDEGIIDVKADIDGEIYNDVKPLFYFTFDEVTTGDTVLVFSINNDESNLFYLKKNINIPYLTDTGIEIENKKIEVKEDDPSTLNISNGFTFFKLIDDGEESFVVDEENVILEGTIDESYPKDETSFKVTELEEEIDYKYKIFEITYKNNDEVIVRKEKRLIVDFDLEESIIEIGSPLEISLNLELYPTLEFKIYDVDLNSLSFARIIRFLTSNGFGISIEEANAGVSGIKLETPSNKFTIHENTIKLPESGEGDLARYSDQYLEYISSEYSQIYGGDKTITVHSEMLDHEFRRPYKFGIYNQDYIDVDDEERHRNLGVLLQTPKHVFRIIDSSGIGDTFISDDEAEGVKEQYIEYSSLDGNYFKLVSNSSLGSALELRTKEGHNVVFDNSIMKFEQFKKYDKDEKALLSEEMPVNFIKMDKTEDAEKITIESHQHGPEETENWETIYNKFEFSETPDNATWTLENVNDTTKNSIIMDASADEASIKIEGSFDDGTNKNEISLVGGSDTVLKITNQFDDGKENIITMTTDLISIKNAEEKVTIEITADGMKIVTEADFEIEPGGDCKITGGGAFNVEASGDVAIKGASVTLDGPITLKSGDGGPWQPNIISACIYSGAPHGGSAGGIANLTGA